MGERTIAQEVAAENWRYLKSQVRYWRSWKYTPSNHPPAYAAWVAAMRNAWVAYHAVAPWMLDPNTVELARTSTRLRLAEGDREEARWLAEEFAQRLADKTGEDVFLPWTRRTPDPDHVPAVRRVVAWELDDREGTLVHDPVTAYQNAADNRLENSASTPRFRRRLNARSGADRWGYWRAVRNRLASLLRHRDEEAGCR